MLLPLPPPKLAATPRPSSDLAPDRGSGDELEAARARQSSWSNLVGIGE